MNVKDLRPNAKIDQIELELTEMSEPKEFTSKWGSSGKVCNAQGKDGEGDTVAITFWNDEIDQYQTGDKIRITDGYAKEFRGDIQVSAGKYGKLEKL